MGTADLVSSRLGEQTIIVESGGKSEGASWQHSMGAQHQNSASQSSNTSSNWQQQARKLLKPEEVIALPPRVAITFAPGVPPICTTLLRYYEEPWLGRGTSRLACGARACHVLAASLALFSLSLGVFVLIVKTLRQALAL